MATVRSVGIVCVILAMSLANESNICHANGRGYARSNSASGKITSDLLQKKSKLFELSPNDVFCRYCHWCHMDAADMLLHERACGQIYAFCIFEDLGCCEGRMKRRDLVLHMQSCSQKAAPACFGSMLGCKYHASTRDKFWSHHFSCPFVRSKTDILDDDDLFPLFI